MSRGLESASAPLRNGNRCWYAHRPCRDLIAVGFRWNRSKNSKDWPYSSDCDCEISTVVGKTLWPFRKYTGGWRPAPRSFDARSGALGMVALESDATCVALNRWLRTTRFEPEAHTLSDGQTLIKQGGETGAPRLTISPVRSDLAGQQCRLNQGKPAHGEPPV